jgi:uncharacterized phage protein (TIGR01671 family)
MREHLYRGKCVESGNWFYGSLIKTRNNEYLIVDWDYGFIFEKCIHKVIPETVGQYTELKDANGKEAFEEDIILITGGFLYVVKYGEFLPICLEEYLIELGRKPSNIIGLYGQCVKGEGDDVLIPSGGRFQIIGNIHDNPELLTLEADNE